MRKKTSDFLAEGTHPKFDDLRMLANYDPIVKHCLTFMAKEKLPLEQTLIAMIFVLVEQSEELRAELLTRRMQDVSPLIIRRKGH